MEPHDFSRANDDSERRLAPAADAVTDLIVALSICATSLNQLADEVVRCAACTNDPDQREDLWAAARGQRIRVLEVQGMLAVLTKAFTESYVGNEGS